MDSLREPVGSRPRPAEDNGAAVDSKNMQAIKQAFAAYAEGGMDAATEALIALAHPDCVFKPYSAGSQALRGPDEVRAFFRQAAAAGESTVIRTQAFEEHGDEIVVSGSIRVQRPGEGFAESQVRWTYRFRDGLVEEAHWGPRHPG